MSARLYLSDLYVYPIKSLGGYAVESAKVAERGLDLDRRWMLVDENNRFLTQRNHPRMALLQVSVTADQLIVSVKNASEKISIPQQPQTSDVFQASVWDDTCDVVAAAPETDAFFSDYLGQHCRLVYMPDDSIRPVDPRYDIDNNYTSLSDAYPFLVIGQSSLNDLNSRLDEVLPMNRFRPNLVVSGSEPYAEERWHEFKVGETTFFGVKPCARCIVTTTNQDTAEVGKEPLRTLAKYHKTGNKIIFGQNLIFGRKGSEIRVGDAVEIVSYRS